MKNLIDIYVNFLISSFGKIEMTKLSEILDGLYSHDVDKELWLRVKAMIRKYENEKDGCILIDDSVLHKPYTKENDIVAWHYDHSSGKCVKGICMLNFHYTNAEGISIPLEYEIISKTEEYFDEKTGKTKKKVNLQKMRF